MGPAPPLLLPMFRFLLDIGDLERLRKRSPPRSRLSTWCLLSCLSSRGENERDRRELC